ncbi:MAG TPA: CoA-transferase [Gemmatimonadaceae bacterium]|nr:CoA-transferase [Gemmatimonadaceae bacterium]
MASITASDAAIDHRDVMVCVAASELRDGDVVFVGIGLPSLACNLARAMHAPNLQLIYESGTVGTRPQRIPLSIGDPALVTGALMVAPMADVFQLILQRGHIDVGFLGAAQIDRAGNINTTIVGRYDAPKVRLPGSGGAAEIAAHAKRVIVVTSLDKRAFPERVDFITSPGRRVTRVITDKCIFDRDAGRHELVLSALYAGVSVDEVRAGVGWDLRVAAPLSEVAPPSPSMLTALRRLRKA